MFKVFRSWLDHFFADEQALLLVVLLAVGLTAILMFGSTLAPVITSMILAYLTLGLVQWLERFGVKHLLAVWGIYSLFIALLITFVFIVLPLLWHQATDLLSNLPLMLEKLMDLFMLLPERYPELVSGNQIKQLADAAMAEIGNAGQLLVTFSLASIGQSLTWLVFLVLVPILVFFFLKDGHMMVRWFTAFLPIKRNILSHVWLEMDQQIANYVRGKVVEIGIVGSATYLAFLWLDLNYAALLAVIVVFYTASSGAKAAITGIRMVTGSERATKIIRFQGVSILMTALLILAVWILGALQLMASFITENEGYIAFDLAQGLSDIASRLWLGKGLACFAIFYMIIALSLHGRIKGNRAKAAGAAAGGTILEQTL